MLIDGIVIGLIFAKLAGGKFAKLLLVHFTAPWLIAIAFVVQYASIFFFPNILLIAILISYILLFLFSVLNRMIPGFYLVLAGIFMNILVMMVNKGRMPVELEAAKDLSPEDFPALVAGEYGKHIAMSDQTHLNFLGDIFYLHAPYPHPTIVSLGDIVFSMGMIYFIYKIMIKGKKQVQGSVC